MASIFEVKDKTVEITGALIVTASHNPKEYNGLKMTLHRHSFNADDIKQVAKYAQDEFEHDKGSYYMPGELAQYNIISDYIDSQLKNFPKIFPKTLILRPLCTAQCVCPFRAGALSAPI